MVYLVQTKCKIIENPTILISEWLYAVGISLNILIDTMRLCSNHAQRIKRGENKNDQCQGERS